MPTLKDFGAFKITMYAGDHNPPHFHIVSPEEEALIAIADLSLMAGGVSGRVLRRALAWATENRALLEATWRILSRTR